MASCRFHHWSSLQKKLAFFAPVPKKHFVRTSYSQNATLWGVWRRTTVFTGYQWSPSFCLHLSSFYASTMKNRCCYKWFIKNALLKIEKTWFDPFQLPQLCSCTQDFLTEGHSHWNNKIDCTVSKLLQTSEISTKPTTLNAVLLWWISSHAG